MKPFSKTEAFGIFFILIVVGSLTISGLITSLTRSRDAQRMSDLGAISGALDKFQAEYGFFPPSDNGKIVACKADNFDEVLASLSGKEFRRDIFFTGLRACNWGEDSIADLANSEREPYLSRIPIDPKFAQGYSYHYISNTKRYQVYTALEGGVSDDVYDEKIVARNISCGKMTCQAGRSYATTPLDISIEQYEQLLLEESSRK